MALPAKPTNSQWLAVVIVVGVESPLGATHGAGRRPANLPATDGLVDEHVRPVLLGLDDLIDSPGREIEHPAQLSDPHTGGVPRADLVVPGTLGGMAPGVLPNCVTTPPRLGDQ